MQDILHYEIRKPAAILSINRPDKRNALSRALIVALTEGFARAQQDRNARCVILTGTGTAFCAGMDLDELRGTLENPDEAARVWDDAHKLSELYELIYRMPKPTIAAVNGAAVAGGAGLVTVCDLALAVPAARFGYPEVRRGLVAAMVLPHLLRHVGERAARYLLLTGDLIDADEAVRVGLINRVVEPETLMDQAMRWASFLAEGGPNSLASTKELLVKCSTQALPVAEFAKASAAPRLTEECRQGLEAFFNKKTAPWVSPDS
jgi:methylglutaconyl-CoA hydratase